VDRQHLAALAVRLRQAHGNRQTISAVVKK
jgi:hypothetical protein